MGSRPGARVITLFFFSYSTHLHMDFIMLINIERPTIIGILTIFNIINIISESWKARKPFIFLHFCCCEQLKCYAQLNGV